MKKILILGSGSAGTMMANHLQRRLKSDDYKITIIDRDTKHLYQPGLLFIPFGKYQEKDIVKSRAHFIPSGVDFLIAELDRIEPTKNTVILKSGKSIDYDLLIIATGSRIVPEETEGLLGDGWFKNVFDFYTLEGSLALREFLKTWKGGKLVVHIKEMPIKCPVAPLEFSFLAESYFREKGIRDQVEITYVTPLTGAFTQPIASAKLGNMLKEKQIKVISDFDVERVDQKEQKIISYDGREVPYDLLVSVPTHMGDPAIERSNLGDELGFIPTNAGTLQSKSFQNIFVLGDATNIQASKAGSVAHFESEVATDNIIRYFEGKELQSVFDGHSNCFIESGNGKGLLIDFNSKVQPLPGKFPLSGIGPFSLLKESRINHWGKLAFRWIYWHLLLKGRSIPFISTTLSMRGKKL